MEIFKLPQGVKDFLPKTATEKVALENGLLKTFSDWGYERIDTSCLVNYGVYADGTGAVQSPKLFKLSDTDGELLVLRSDMTLPITRIAATKLNSSRPLRLCYQGSSYNLSPDRDRDREYSQTGVELFGVGSAEGDAEVIALAIDALISVGLKDFKIDLGQVGIVKGVLENTALSASDITEIVGNIDKKMLIFAGDYAGLTEKEADLINNITLLYGDESVISEAEKLVKAPDAIAALNNLRKVYTLLTAYGYADFLSFDLGLVNSYSYYTGTVFKGITRHLGAPVLGGGRYDTLADKFGKSLPATGFAVGISDLMRALRAQGTVGKAEENITLIGSSDDIDSRKEARRCAAKLIKNGARAKLVYDVNKAELKELAEKEGQAFKYFGGEK